MNIVDFLSELQALNIDIRLNAEKLRVDAPSGTLTDSLKSKLAAHEQEIIAFFERNSQPTAMLPPIQPADRSGHIPLSFSQQRLWLLHQMEDGARAYHNRRALHITGSLDLEALEKSLREVVRRHDSLRSTFHEVMGTVVQVVDPDVHFTLSLLDLQSKSEVEQQVMIQSRMSEENYRLFDLTSGPLFFVQLIQLGESSYVLLLTMHHIISDGWSMSIFWQELSSLYAAFTAGQPSPLETLDIQYADFVNWQRDLIDEPFVQRQLDYWQQELGDAPPLLALPTDRPRPPVQQSQGSVFRFVIPATLRDRLQALSRQHYVTLFMTLYAAFAVVLSRYCQTDDVVVGTAVADRSQKELESLIGCFINTLVLRTELSGNPTFEELLLEVQEVALAAYEQSFVPFDHVVEALQPERNLAYSPVFQVLFILQNPLDEALTLADLTVESLPLEQNTAKFDLTLDMQETDAGISAQFEYRTDLFDAASIERLAGHLITLLEAVTENPQQPVMSIALLTPAEQETMRYWNHTQRDYPRERLLHQLVEAQVERRPDAIALTFDGQDLSYRELNVQANQLARHLMTFGVSPDTLVGLCVERSPALLISLLAVLKAGAAYLPLDPTYPEDRLTFMLSDSQAELLVTEDRLSGKFKDFTGHVVRLDSDRETIVAQKDDDPVCAARSENLAYMIYTSGSTGRPKGVQLQHQSVVNFLYSMAREPGMAEDDVLLAITTISFDIAALELYLPLMMGARIVLATREEVSDGIQLLRLLENEGVSIIQGTPATWRLLLAAGWQGDRKLKALCGGEAFPADLVPQVLARTGSLWNMYGPTETTVWSSIYRIDQAHKTPGQDDIMVTIGRPIDNTEILILSPHLQLVPIGVPGELYIGGDGLARGYFNRPELNAERFIAHPFRDKANARLYKTGDLARYLPDGNIEYIGRVDQQVKVRGYRIELGEIETVLGRHPDLRAAVVIVREDIPGDKRLVAYVIPQPNRSPDSDELRELLGQYLPQYMIPSHFVMMDRFPLTPNGKVNRRALAAPVSAGTGAQDFAAPRNPTEVQLAEIWKDILKLDRISIHDNFFRLGGHSLLAMQAMARSNSLFEKTMPVVTLFQNQTIAQLSAVVQGDSTAEAWNFLVPIRSTGTKPPLFHIGGVVLLNDLAHYLGENQPVYGLVEQGLEEDKNFTNVAVIASHLLQEIKAVRPYGPYHIAGMCAGGNVAFEVAQRLRHEGEEVALLALIECYRPGAIRLRKSVVTRYAERLKRLRNELAKRPLAREKLDYIVFKLREGFRKQIWRRLWRFLRQHQRDNPGGLSGILVDAIEANEEAVRGYQPQHYPGDVVLIRAEDRPGWYDYDPRMGWGEFVSAAAEPSVTPGDHTRIYREPNVEVLAEQLSAALDKGHNSRAK